MFPLSEMLTTELLIRDKRACHTANIFGLIAYSERNPFVVKVLRDKDFWNSLNSRTEGWILYAVKPDDKYYGGGNAAYIDESLGLTPKDYPQLIILSIGQDRVMKQRNYPIESNSLESTYNSIEANVEVVTKSVEKILPNYKNSTNVYREVVKALDAELATSRWKKVASGMIELVKFLMPKAV